MKKDLLLLIVLSLGFHCCGQVNKSNPATISKHMEVPNTSKGTKTETSIDKYIDTKYLYVDDNGKLIIIQNGLPRGGSRYTDPTGEEYGYAIFWTRIINDTDNPLELKIDFLTSYPVPSIPDKNFKILVLPDTMTIDKVDTFSFGLTELDSFLDKRINTPSTLERTINQNDSTGFYIVKLSLTSEGPRGGGDILRTGLRLKGQDIFYNVSVYNNETPPSIISENDFYCGNINLKTLEFRK